MRPWSLLFTLFGEPIRHHGGQASARTLIQLMSLFSFSEGAVRAALYRMVQQGWLSSARVGRETRYSLTAKGNARLEEAARRIYRLDNAPWDGAWRVVTYSIPEGRRPARDQLRKELAWQGFGPLTAGTWITPHDLLPEALASAHRFGVADCVQTFLAHARGPWTDPQLVARCWNLEDIARRYQEFIRAETAREGARRAPLTPEAAFRERTLLVHEYRKFLFIDPALPAALLPANWPGEAAARLFGRIETRLAPQAQAYYRQVADSEVVV